MVLILQGMSGLDPMARKTQTKKTCLQAMTNHGSKSKQIVAPHRLVFEVPSIPMLPQQIMEMRLILATSHNINSGHIRSWDKSYIDIPYITVPGSWLVKPSVLVCYPPPKHPRCRVNCGGQCRSQAPLVGRSETTWRFQGRIEMLVSTTYLS